ELLCSSACSSSTQARSSATPGSVRSDVDRVQSATGIASLANNFRLRSENRTPFGLNSQLRSDMVISPTLTACTAAHLSEFRYVSGCTQLLFFARFRIRFHNATVRRYPNP